MFLSEHTFKKIYIIGKLKCYLSVSKLIKKLNYKLQNKY